MLEFFQTMIKITLLPKNVFKRRIPVFLHDRKKKIKNLFVVSIIVTCKYHFGISLSSQNDSRLIATGGHE